MSEPQFAPHDPLCPVMYGEDGFWHCVCGVIAKVRTDERLKVLAEYGLEEKP